MNTNLQAPCTCKQTHSTAMPGAHLVLGGPGATSKGDLMEHPRGGLPTRLWADPFSLTGESAEGKRLGLQLCPLEIPTAPPNCPLSGQCGAPRFSSDQAQQPSASPKKFLGVFPSASEEDTDSSRGPLPNVLRSRQQCGGCLHTSC
ncbi:hypothetical protein P4O66_005279 [Electrophorus voltai]|uniref:Uncharacterized protein n=1 Tax=Electrophorus voltai TaxID=2609070 RepID=A0AAD8ZYY6_9TELE|nr:hypothetical protein P4O66_005279 [Electrophorus voltai]